MATRMGSSPIYRTKVKDPNQIFPVGDGFGFFVYSGKTGAIAVKEKKDAAVAAILLESVEVAVRMRRFHFINLSSRILSTAVEVA